MRNKKRSLRGRIAPLAIAGATLISGFMPLVSNAGVWARPDNSLNYIEGMLMTFEHINSKTLLDVDSTSDGGFIAAGPFYQQDFSHAGNGGVDDMNGVSIALGSSLVKYNANSEVEWNKKVSEFHLSVDPELDELIYGEDDHDHSSTPILGNGDQSFIFYPDTDSEELAFVCYEKDAFMSALRNEREPQQVDCPDVSVGLIYGIEQATDGGYVGLSGGFSSLTDFLTSIMSSRSRSIASAVIGALDSSLVKFDANGDKVWSTVITGEAVANALGQDFRSQGLITNGDEVLMPSVTLVKDLIALSDGGYITSGVSVSAYGRVSNLRDDDDYGPVVVAPADEEEGSEPKIIYSGVLEKFNNEGRLVGVKTFATKTFTDDQLAEVVGRDTMGRSEDLIRGRMLYPDEHPDGHYYCMYDYNYHGDDPNYINYYGDYYTECRENDYFYVRMLGMSDDGNIGDDPIKTEEYLDYFRGMLALGTVILPTQTTPTSDGGVVISGAEFNIGLNFNDMLSGTVIKFDGSLNQQWTYKVTDENRRFSAFRDVTETADGGFVAVGAATKVMPISSYIVKIDANGNKVWDTLWLDDETGAISSGAIGVTELTTGQIVVIGANFEDVNFDNMIELSVASRLRDMEYIRENINFDDIIDFDGYILVLDGITGKKALSQSTPKVNSRITRMADGKLVVINMDASGNQAGAPIQLIADATIVDFSDVLPNNGGNNGDDDYSDITVPNTGVSNEIAQVPLILGAITMAAPFVLKMMARARKHGKATSFNK